MEHHSQGGNMKHCSTGKERSELVSQLLVPKPRHGLVSELSREYHVPRQTLYRWKEIGAKALEEALEIKPKTPKERTQVEEYVLTLFIEAHASYRNIQKCLQRMHSVHVSLGSIVNIVQEAGKRAQRWLTQQRARTPRALALDEQYSSQRGKAYLNVVDVHSGQVWATFPPVEVDGESWILVWWYLQEQGLECWRSVSDGGRAIAEALDQVKRLCQHQRDVWHVLDFASQVQRRGTRVLQQLLDRLPTIQRQAERVAQGKKPLGRAPETDVAGHEKQITQATYVTEALSYLSQELHSLLQVVVLRSHPQAHVIDSKERESEMQAWLSLLSELAEVAPSPMRTEIQSLTKHVRLALPHLLLFAADLDEPVKHACERLGSEAVYLIAWAWQRRETMGITINELLDGLDPAWRKPAQILLQAWGNAVRASSAVENWHSIVRPHLAAHRKLSAGMLALLAVCQNHQVAPRGLHEGLSPLQRTGHPEPQTDWLVALGYSRQAA
jgi:transposase-like protein